MNEWNENEHLTAEDSEPELVTVEDEDGVVHTFEQLDAIEYEDRRYVALIPVYDDPAESLDDSGELIILEVQEEDGASFLAPIEDDDVYDEIADIFEERLSEFYEIDSE